VTRAGAFVVAAVLTGCTCGSRVRPEDCTLQDAGPGNRPYSLGTESQRREIARDVASLATVTGPDLLAAGRRIVEHGEPSVPPLLEALRGPTPRVRSQAAYLLGALQDRRTIPDLLAATSDPEPTVRYEAAGALLELREPRGLAPLVDGLSDPDPRLRSKCIEVLAEKTGQRFGFAADGSPEDRAAAIARWREWTARSAAPTAPGAPGPDAPGSAGR
jgi:HEAT repeat protein